MRCQIDIHLVHQFLILYYLLSGVFWTLWVPQISRQATDHVEKTTSFGTITMGPTILIFPRDNMIGHLRGTYFKNLNFSIIVFENKQLNVSGKKSRCQALK